MKIELTQEQYKKLLNLVYMGNYMINGVRTPEENVAEYQDLCDHVFGYAAANGMSDLVSTESGKALPSEAFEMNEELNEYIDTYDQITFFDELDMRLGEQEEGDCCDEDGDCCDEDGDCCDEELDFEELEEELDEIEEGLLKE